MADLDDFFAKKDRKKSKSKKFASTDELAKKMDDPKQKTDIRPKKERSAQDGEESGRGTEEEEWREYEEPVKDYTGLKLQVLQGGNGQQGAAGSDGSGCEDYREDCGKNKGPWNNKPVEVEEKPPVEKPAPVEPSVYVPPAGNRGELLKKRTQSKHAPDINSDASFPSLGAAPRPPAPRARAALHTNNRYYCAPRDRQEAAWR